MGRFTRAIRGFFGRFLTGVEQRNPEILLENAVQDELENLKKLQVAAARTMAYEKMLANDAAGKQKVLAVKERQARELASRGQRDAAVEVVQQKQEAQTQLVDIESRLEEARKNSQEMERAFRDQERRYNDVVRERAALMEEHQRDRAPDSRRRDRHQAPRRRARARDDGDRDGPARTRADTGPRAVARGARCTGGRPPCLADPPGSSSGSSPSGRSRDLP